VKVKGQTHGAEVFLSGQHARAVRERGRDEPVNVDAWFPMATRSGVVPTRLANRRRAWPISPSYPVASARPVRQVSRASLRAEFLLRVCQAQYVDLCPSG
jgi:hypothetical protein